MNGTTNPDRTNYFITVPAGGLERVLWLESDRLATLMDFLTKENLDHQREVVKNERRQGLENTPYGRAFKLIFESVYPAGHPYSWLTIGSQEDLSAATFDDVKEFFRTYYTPNNLSLIVAGDFDPAEAKRLVAKYFGPIPPGPALDRPGRSVPALSGEKIVEVADRVPLERVYVAFPSAPFFEKGDAELDLASLILTDGLSSRLQKALVYDRQLCSTVQASQNSAEISGLFFVSATARPGVKLADVERVVTDEIARLAKSGPTAAELDRAKTKYEFRFVSGLEGIGGFGGKSDLLNRYNIFLGDPGRLAEDLGRYRACDGGGRPRRGGEVDRHPEPGPRAFPSGDVGPRRPPRRSTGPRSRPRRPTRRSARRTSRPRRFRTGSRSTSWSAPSSRRSSPSLPCAPASWATRPGRTGRANFTAWTMSLGRRRERRSRSRTRSGASGRRSR